MSSTKIGQFDSASTMVRVLAAALEGQHTVGLAMPKRFNVVARASQFIPPSLRSRLFSLGAANEAIELKDLGPKDGPRAAEWVTSQYKNLRKAPAIFIGATNGAVADLAAGLGAPWLPQTFLVLVRRKVDPDDIAAVIQHGQRMTDRLADNFPGIVTQQMHDPLNDRGNAAQAAYLRMKWHRLPDAYRDFIRNHLEPGGTIFITGCRYQWPSLQLGKKHFFQLGGYGAIAAEDLLSRYGYSYSDAWQLRPEAEWGYEDALTADIQDAAAAIDARVLRLNYDDPQALSAPISRLFIKDDPRHLLVTNFNMLAPAFIQRSDAIPHWVVFNDQKSLSELANFLRTHGPFERIDSLLFQNGAEAEGQALASDWLNVLSAHTTSARLLGLSPAQHPHDFASFDRYRQSLREAEKGLRTPVRGAFNLKDVLGGLQREGLVSVL